MKACHTHDLDGKPLTCDRLVDLLTDYVDGEMPEELRKAMDEHMGQCAPCVAFMREYRFSNDAARRCMLKKGPDTLEDRLLGFLRGRCQKHAKK